MQITIHQPEHLPWLGFFHKIGLAEHFVVLDNVQYRKQYFQNRNKVKTNNGPTWMTVPIQKSPHRDLKIQDVIINTESLSWMKKNLKTIKLLYQSTPYFSTYFEEFSEIYQNVPNRLSDYNLNLIRFFLKHFEIKCKMSFSSEMNLTQDKNELILEICKKMKAKTYISGISGKDYLKLPEFSKNNINVSFQEFYHPIYKQRFGEFTPCMSSLDLLFNEGPKSKDFIFGKECERLDYLFL